MGVPNRKNQPLLSEQIAPRFYDLLSRATAIDVAVAWATSVPVQAILERGVDLRAVVGIDGDVTQPETLWQIKRHGQLRLGNTSGSGIFHPKLFMFYLREAIVCWIGSANLTSAALYSNTELVHEFEDDGTIQDLFCKIWETGVEADEQRLSQYARNWQAPSPPKPTRESRQFALEGPPLTGLLNGVTTPEEYLEALEKADDFWRDLCIHSGYPEPFRALGDPISFESTIKTGQQILTRDFSWDRLSEREREFLVGRAHGAALLGNLDGAAQAASAIRGGRGEQNGRIRRGLGRTMEALAGLGNDEFLEQAPRYTGSLLEIPHVGLATVTRFIAFLRPDLAVVVNGENAHGWSVLTGMPEGPLRNTGSTGRRAEVYARLLQWVQQQPWNQGPDQWSGGRLSRIAPIRAALLDVFVYSGGHLMRRA